MKKIYNQPEIELIIIEDEVITTASTNVADPFGLLDDDRCDTWQW